MSVDPKTLPVYKHKDEITSLLAKNQVLIVESPTGSGKTTQIPLILDEAGYSKNGIIGITQPRRIATLSVTEYIKKQLNDEGSYCGYAMRFYDTTTAETKIKIMTDGILLQEVKDDPLLSRYSVIMVDEAHERSLNIDFILGLLKEIIEERQDLKVIISSATINTKVFSSFFNNAPVLSIDSHPFPVEINYIPIKLKEKRFDSTSYYDEYYDNPYKKDWYNTRDAEKEKKELQNSRICQIVKETHKKNDGGDVLIFLEGESEIKECMEALDKINKHNGYEIYPLFSRLSKEEQEEVFTPTKKGKTKVVIATNIAETSLTIDGIKTVIDSGKVKINYYNQTDHTQSLLTQKISRSSADQRKGRAGRTSPGVCYRLYSEKDYKKRKEFSEEQILHSDLAEVVLRMSSLGIYNTETFPFITSPGIKALRSAEDTLLSLGAIENDHHLTHIGEEMISYPLTPRLSRVVIESIQNYPDVLYYILIIVSFLSTKTPFALPKDKEDEDYARSIHHRLIDNPRGDFYAYLKIYKTYTTLKGQKEREEFCIDHFLDKETMDEIVHIDEQLEEIVRDKGIPIVERDLKWDEYMLSLMSGLRDYICKKENDYYTSSYQSTRCDGILLHPGSSFITPTPKFILSGEIVETSRIFARTVSPIESEWIEKTDVTIARALGIKSKEQLEEEKRIREEKKSNKEKAERRLKKYECRKVKGQKTRYVVPYEELRQIKEYVKYTDFSFIVKIKDKSSFQPIKSGWLDSFFNIVKPIIYDNIPSISMCLVFHNDGYFLLDENNELDKVLSLLMQPIDKNKNKTFSYFVLSEDRDVLFLEREGNFKRAIEMNLSTLEKMINSISNDNQKNLINTLVDKLSSFQNKNYV